MGQVRGVAWNGDIPDWVSTWENGREGQSRITGVTGLGDTVKR